MSTLICRCEGVTYSQLLDAAIEGMRLPAFKRQTRAGMSACQGRYCYHIILPVLQRGWALREILHELQITLEPEEKRELIRTGRPPCRCCCPPPSTESVARP